MDVDTFVDILNLRQNGQTNSSPGNPVNGSGRRLNRIAVIDPNYVAGSGSPYVTFEGESALSGKQFAVAGTYKPQANDRVLMVPVGQSYMIIDQVMNNLQNAVVSSGPRAYETPWHEINRKNEPALSNGWTTYDPFVAVFAAPRFKIDAKGKLRCQGLLYNPTSSQTGLLFTLPSGFRPDQRKRFNCPAGVNGGHAEVTVDTNGNVTLLGYLYSGNANYLDLSKIRFFPSSSAIPWTYVTTSQLLQSWTTPVNSDGQLRYYVDPDGIAHWEGSIGGGTTTGLNFFPLSAGSPLIPDDNLGHIFCQPCANGIARIDVNGAGPNCAILQAGSAANTYISMDGIEYAGANNICKIRLATGSGLVSAFANSWANFNTGFGVARYYKCSAGIVYVSGLLQGGTIAAILSAFPPGYRTSAVVITSVIASNVESRIDTGNGGTMTVSGYGTGGSNGFLSLEDIRYPAEF